MKCVVYRSNKKPGAYVYCSEDFKPAELPDELQALLGVCEVVMTLNLSERDKLARENIQNVRDNLNNQGYHLQLPPKDATGVIEVG